MATDRRQFLQGAGIAAATAAASTLSTPEVLAQVNPKPVPGLPAAKPLIKVDAVATTIEKKAGEKMRKRLGLKPTDPLPKEVSDLIKAQAKTASSVAVEFGASRDAQAAAREFGRMVTVEDFQEKLVAARNGIQTIGQSQDVDAILKERANMLWKKRESLVAAGFSAEDAMQILLSDIAARGH